jgi:hypothetical protein
MGNPFPFYRFFKYSSRLFSLLLEHLKKFVISDAGALNLAK